MSSEEREPIVALDAILRPEGLRTLIDSKVQLARQKLDRDGGAVLAWEAVPLDWYGDKLPSAVRSSWVFILRAGAATGAERHPNSHQRMMSYQGAGDLQIWQDDRWHSNLLVSDPNAELEKRWVSIPRNVWHQAEVPAEYDHWVVVSFHTAPENELIEERPDPADSRFTQQRKYAEMEEGAR